MNEVIHGCERVVYRLQREERIGEFLMSNVFIAESRTRLNNVKYRWMYSTRLSDWGSRATAATLNAEKSTLTFSLLTLFIDWKLDGFNVDRRMDDADMNASQMSSQNMEYN